MDVRTVNRNRREIPLFFYGWIIVPISFITLGSAYGAKYCFSVFCVTILDEFGWSLSATSTILSLNLIIYALIAPFAGTFTDRYGPRKVLPLGGAPIGKGLIVCNTW